MKRSIFAVAAAAALSMGVAAQAQAEFSGDVVKIGVLTDMSGVYNAITGRGAVVAAQMAVEDFGGEVLGRKIQIVSADHQNRPDVASARVREWIDRDGVDMIVDLVTSSVGLAAQRVASDKGVITINTGAATTALTNSECTALGIHYAYDTYALAAGVVQPVVDAGGDNWYFITADYVFGHTLEDSTRKVLDQAGAKVAGSVRHPFPSNDFSSFLMQAQGSGANVIALANAGQDTTNAVRQAGEFGIGKGKQQLVGLLVFSSDVKSLGLRTAQGLQFVDSWYWDMNDETRAFAERFEKRTGAKPTSVQAADYSAVLQYLKAVEAAGTDDGKAVRAQMAKMTMNDVYHQNARLREDGRVLHDMYLMRVKAPSESSGEWDLLEIVGTIPAEQAFQPLSQSSCALVNNG